MDQGTRVLHSTVTGKGQTTIPADVRSTLGLAVGDRVAYEVRNGQVTLRRHPGSGPVFGILKGKPRRPVDPAGERAAARRAWADHAAGEGRAGR